MIRVSSVLLVALFVAADILPQAVDRRGSTTTCILSKSQIKDVRGFHLGTKWKEVVARFPGLLKESAMAQQIELLFADGECHVLSQSGRKSVSYFKRSKFSDFSEVSRLLLLFSDGEIVLIKVTYDGTTHWKTLDDFAMAISEGLSLPNAWRTGSNPAERVIECGGFTARASLESTCKIPGFCGSPEKLVYLPTLALADITVLERTMERLRKQIEEQKRREEEKRKIFKP